MEGETWERVGTVDERSVTQGAARTVSGKWRQNFSCQQIWQDKGGHIEKHICDSLSSVFHFYPASHPSVFDHNSILRPN